MFNLIKFKITHLQMYLLFPTLNDKNYFYGNKLSSKWNYMINIMYINNINQQINVNILSILIIVASVRNCSMFHF